MLHQLDEELHRAIDNFEFIAVDRDDANNNPGFCRVSANIPIKAELFNQFFNGRTGYRAQYYESVETGESFNGSVVDLMTGVILQNRRLLTEAVSPELCEKSLGGPHTKVWFPKEVTSPDYEPELLLLSETIRAQRWVDYWRSRSRPRKGLLAPRPAEPAILLNGTFVNPNDWSVWNQKPDRSRQVFESGWT